MEINEGGGIVGGMPVVDQYLDPGEDFAEVKAGGGLQAGYVTKDGVTQDPRKNPEGSGNFVDASGRVWHNIGIPTGRTDETIYSSRAEFNHTGRLWPRAADGSVPGDPDNGETWWVPVFHKTFQPTGDILKRAFAAAVTGGQSEIMRLPGASDVLGAVSKSGPQGSAIAKALSVEKEIVGKLFPGSTPGNAGGATYRRDPRTPAGDDAPAKDVLSQFLDAIADAIAALLGGK